MRDRGMATTGMNADRSEPRNRKDDDHDDQQGFAQGLDHLVDGIGDIVGGVVGDARLHAAGQLPSGWPPSRCARG